MSFTTEIADALRCCYLGNVKSCMDCPYVNYRDLEHCGHLLPNAADAIDDLYHKVKKMDIEIESLLLLVNQKDNVIESLSKIEALYKTETIAQKWIPVSEHLPVEPDKYVFTWSDEYGDLDISCRIAFETMGVTHWMPITYPEPPKEET